MTQVSLKDTYTKWSQFMIALVACITALKKRSYMHCTVVSPVWDPHTISQVLVYRTNDCHKVNVNKLKKSYRPCMAADGDAHHYGQWSGVHIVWFYSTVLAHYRALCEPDNSCSCTQQISCPLQNTNVQYYFIMAQNWTVPETHESW